MLQLMERPYVAMATLHQLNDISTTAYASWELNTQACGLTEDPTAGPPVVKKPAYAAYREIATRGGTFAAGEMSETPAAEAPVG